MAVKNENSLQKTITEIIEEVSGDIRDNLCRYRETTDDDCICDYVRTHEYCPLDRLQ